MNSQDHRSLLYISIEDYLKRERGWRPTRRVYHHIYGLCPFHAERNASFVIWEDEGTYKCFGCQVSGDIVRMVKELEFSAESEEKIGWAKAYKRVRELSGITEPLREGRSGGASLTSSSTTPTPTSLLSTQNTRIHAVSTPIATSEQQHCLDAAFAWWHEQLTLSHRGIPARTWLEEKGIASLSYPFPLIGYAPIMDTAAFLAFDDHMSKALNTAKWQQLGVETGLLTQRGQVRLQHRLMFGCLSSSTNNDNDDNKGGHICYYQGRTLLSDEEAKARRQSKYTSPPSLKPSPFFIPLIQEPILPGTCIVEGPKEAWVLSQYGLAQRAILGSGVTPSLLLACPTPWWILTNHEPNRLDRRGTLTNPGERLAEEVKALAQQEGKEYYDLHEVIPLEYKDIDRWVPQEGIEPLLSTIQYALATNKVAL